MLLHPENSSRTPACIWEELERLSVLTEDEQLLEEYIPGADGAGLLLGLIVQTGERTLHVRVQGGVHIGFETPSIKGLWVKTIIFPDHHLVAVVLEDEGLQDTFAEFAQDVIHHVNSIADQALITNILSERLRKWSSLFTGDSARKVA